MRGDRKADRHLADRIAAQLLELVLRAAHVVEDRGGAAHERLPERGRDHSLGAALEQRRAQLAFKLGEASRKRGLRDAEVAGGGGRRRARRWRRRGELGQFHGVILAIPKRHRQTEIWHLAVIARAR